MSFSVSAESRLIEKTYQHLYEYLYTELMKIKAVISCNFVWPYEIREWQCAFKVIFSSLYMLNMHIFAGTVFENGNFG